MASWHETRLEARIWWCGDDDCTQPVIERISPNLEAGYPWIRRETLWAGEFLTDTRKYGQAQREAMQFAQLREACQRLGVPVPEDLYDVPAIEVELAGGYFDGRRMRVPDNRDTWRLPVPPGIGSFGPEPDVTVPALDAAVYRWSGSVRDDGTRVFRFAFMS